MTQYRIKNSNVSQIQSNAARITVSPCPNKWMKDSINIPKIFVFSIPTQKYQPGSMVIVYRNKLTV